MHWVYKTVESVTSLEFKVITGVIPRAVDAIHIINFSLPCCNFLLIFDFRKDEKLNKKGECVGIAWVTETVE